MRETGVMDEIWGGGERSEREGRSKGRRVRGRERMIVNDESNLSLPISSYVHMYVYVCVVYLHRQ